MVDAKIKKEINKKFKREPYHKYIDMRALIPAAVIAFILSIFAYLYVNEAVLSAAIYLYVAFAIGGIPTFLASDGTMFMFPKVIFFTIDFIVFLVVSYVLLWIIVREQDKREYYHMKKKRQL